MSFRVIPQYSQGYPQIPSQSVNGANQSLTSKRNQIGRQSVNNIQPSSNIQPFSFSNSYGEVGQQHGPALHVTQHQQQTVQYYIQQPPQPQFNSMPNSQSVYPQFVQSGYSYPLYQTKNIVASHESPVRQIQSHIHQQPVQHMQASHNQQELMIGQYQKVPVEYIQMQQSKIQRQQKFETKPQLHNQPNHQFINYQQQQAMQQQKFQHRMESFMSPHASTFNPDFNLPPEGPFDIVGRGNLPSFDFVYSQEF